MKTWPSKTEAETLLAWGGEQNPGPWVDHCKTAARAAQAIAEQCGMDTERAYVSGLLHDIGYYANAGKSANADKSGKNCHVYRGYALMTDKGYTAIAGICLTHSFNIQDICVYSGASLTQNKNELAVITKYLTNTVYNDYDKLIQLCDAICTAEGICTIERRLTDVTLRHGFNKHTVEKWKAYFALKNYFDNKCGMNIYSLFRGEICEGIFR
jgi:putative nucleotidyltransferase with HDIG domain